MKGIHSFLQCLICTRHSSKHSGPTSEGNKAPCLGTLYNCFLANFLALALRTISPSYKFSAPLIPWSYELDHHRGMRSHERTICKSPSFLSSPSCYTERFPLDAFLDPPNLGICPCFRTDNTFHTVWNIWLNCPPSRRTNTVFTSS